MIAGIFHTGSGLGNQLHRYVGTRVLALDQEEEHGMVAPNLFKGASFMNLDMGTELYDYEIEYPAGKVVHTPIISPSGIEIVDGEFQGEDSFMHRIDEVREWLAVEPLDIPDDLCVINFRGGEYASVPELFLPQSYWDEAISMMPFMCKFEVHTDDVETAESFFGQGIKIIHNVGLNWRSIRYSKYLILSNSSFAILPALLGEAKMIIAPKFWAGRNKGYWQLPENQYKRFTYI